MQRYSQLSSHIVDFNLFQSSLYLVNEVYEIAYRSNRSLLLAPHWLTTMFQFFRIMSDIILIFAYSRSSYGVMARRNKSSLSSKKAQEKVLGKLHVFSNIKSNVSQSVDFLLKN